MARRFKICTKKNHFIKTPLTISRIHNFTMSQASLAGAMEKFRVDSNPLSQEETDVFRPRCMKVVAVLMEHKGEKFAPQESMFAYDENDPIQVAEVKKEIRKYKTKEGYVGLMYFSAPEADNLKETLWISKVGGLSAGFKSKQFK